MHWIVLFGYLVLQFSGCDSHTIRRRDTSYDLDEQMGYILSEIKADLASSGDRIKLDDFKDTFGSNKLTKGKIEAINGTFGNLTTLSFFNLSVSTFPDTIAINTLVSMDQLEITYDYFKLSLLLITIDGQISVSVRKNLLDLSISVVFEDTCQVFINRADLKQFDDVHATVTSVGGSLDGQLVNRILQLLIKKYENGLQSMVEARMKKFLKQLSDRICYSFE